MFIKISSKPEKFMTPVGYEWNIIEEADLSIESANSNIYKNTLLKSKRDCCNCLTAASGTTGGSIFKIQEKNRCWN